MLDKKATEATIHILDLLGHSSNTAYFITVQTVILKHLETTYLQGRKDQVDRVNFEQLPNGALKFQDK
jgi:hypothetical protein